MSEPIHIISLGAGVQSSTMALMAAAGEITPMPVAAIFADTQDEPRSVYRWLDWLTLKLPFPVITVTKGRLSTDALRVRVRRDGKGSWVPSGVPHYSINADGTKGHGPRQCTHDFKLIPIIQKQREFALAEMPGWRKRHKDALKVISVHRKALAQWKALKKEGVAVTDPPTFPVGAWDECQSDPLVINWIGISTDEASRVKRSREPWSRNRYPIIERGTSRDGCLRWMNNRGHPEPPESACKFCPYHDDDRWIKMRDDETEDFKEAVEFDYAYRAAKVQTVTKKGFEPFLHDSRVPLDRVVFIPSTPNRQLSLFNNECEGMCGV